MYLILSVEKQLFLTGLASCYISQLNLKFGVTPNAMPDS